MQLLTLTIDARDCEFGTTTGPAPAIPVGESK